MGAEAGTWLVEGVTGAASESASHIHPHVLDAGSNAAPESASSGDFGHACLEIRMEWASWQHMPCEPRSTKAVAEAVRQAAWNERCGDARRAGHVGQGRR